MRRRRAPVAQLAEAGDLKSPQCGFETHRGHSYQRKRCVQAPAGAFCSSLREPVRAGEEDANTSPCEHLQALRRRSRTRSPHGSGCSVGRAGRAVSRRGQADRTPRGTHPDQRRSLLPSGRRQRRGLGGRSLRSATPVAGSGTHCKRSPTGRSATVATLGASGAAVDLVHEHPQCQGVFLRGQRVQGRPGVRGAPGLVPSSGQH